MLKVQKRLAASIMKCGVGRVRFDTERLSDIKEAITKIDIRSLISQGAISKVQATGISNARSAKRKSQKSAGKRRGPGSRKGKYSARNKPKREWMNKVRLQRSFIKSLIEKKLISTEAKKELYSKSKGGFFRSLRHLKLYAKEKGILK